MKKYLVASLLAVIVACSWGIHWAQSTVAITAPDGFSVACANNYIRTMPHFCGATSAVFEQWSLTVDNTCVSHTLTTVPTSATRVLIKGETFITSTNAIGLKQADVNFYNGAACTDATYTFQTKIREFAAVVANTNLLDVSWEHMAVVVGGTSVEALIDTNLTGAATLASLLIIGYYD